VWIKGCNVKLPAGLGDFRFLNLISTETRPYCPPHFLPGCSKGRSFVYLSMGGFLACYFSSIIYKLMIV
jgi:hypothetical protein